MSRRAFRRTAAVMAAAGIAMAGAGTAAAQGDGSGGVSIGGGGTSTGAGGGATGSDVEVGSGVFPIRGRHTYGDGIGAGRGHQGLDILAKCGKPVVAALPGRVSYVGYQGGGAGNYVVIHGSRGQPDTVYMHLADRAAVRKRERIEAGDLLGRVGDTGRASACHLHFEMWSSPGWGKGGELLDPEPYLRRWDRR
jgi:murein DD-endopeptidase MepM/ murein hydrolase activator NlpD